jgi:CBS-domain-containing membrane protein
VVDPKLKNNLGRYTYQVGLAALALGVMLGVEEMVSGAAITSGILVAVIGFTAFTLFIMPHSNTALSRNVVGGHPIVVLLGVVAAAISGTETGHRLLDKFQLIIVIEAAVVVGTSMFLMAATNTEHPAAAGTALAVVTREFTMALAIFFLASVVGMVLLHRLLRRRLLNLY